MKKLEERGIGDVRKVTERDLHSLFSDMRSGILHTRYGTPYKSTGDYVKNFKTFWHWYQKVSKDGTSNLPDITEDLDTRGEKPKFVYFSRADFEHILNEASYDLKPLVALAYDSGARVTELYNVMVSDFIDDFRELNIRDEVSKTFGRRIKLMICCEQIKKYVQAACLRENDYICRNNTIHINEELRHIGKKVLKSDQTKYKNLSLKDFRHSSACFWLPRYKSESALKYRFGWKKTDMIHYYTEFLGMKDTIKEDDMYVDITKTELEKEVDHLRNEISMLKDSVEKLLYVAGERNIV
ncbi:MAG: site-specific integrase [Alphaproteobacteria bacterium]|nr:MAG: site-specific integrase [Alphaproteobacteria bacterium]